MLAALLLSPIQQATAEGIVRLAATAPPPAAQGANPAEGGGSPRAGDKNRRRGRPLSGFRWRQGGAGPNQNAKTPGGLFSPIFFSPTRRSIPARRNRSTLQRRSKRRRRGNTYR